MATADLAEDSRDVGVGDTPQAAVREALRSLGEPYASEMAAGWLRQIRADSIIPPCQTVWYAWKQDSAP